MKTFLLVVFICCCGVFVADAQDLDSLFGVFYLQNTDDAKTEKANEIFKTLKSLDYFSEDVECKKADNFMYGNVYYWHGEVAFEENNFQTASKLGQKALLYIEKIGDLFMLSDCLNLVAISEFSLGNYQKAIDFFNQCYQIDLKTGDESRISSSLNFLAEVYLQINRPQIAEKYILQSIEIEKKLGRRAQLAIRYGRASAVYLQLNDYPLALDFAKRACQLDSVDNRQEKMAVRLVQTSEVYMAMDSDSMALKILNNALEIFETTENNKYIAVCCCKIAKLLFKTTILTMPKTITKNRWFCAVKWGLNRWNAMWNRDYTLFLNKKTAIRLLFI